MSAIVITAVLSKDARTSCSADGRSWLTVEAEGPAGAGKAAAVMARQCFGTGNAAGYACRINANHLRRGVRVTVYANSFGIKAGRLRIDDAERIVAPHLAAAMAVRSGDIAGE